MILWLPCRQAGRKFELSHTQFLYWLVADLSQPLAIATDLPITCFTDPSTPGASIYRNVKSQPQPTASENIFSECDAECMKGTNRMELMPRFNEGSESTHLARIAYENEGEPGCRINAAGSTGSG